MSQNEPHDEFLELCAASITGDLSPDEQKRLQEHIPVCTSCQEALRRYESIASDVMPAVAAHESQDNRAAGSDWTERKQEQAERMLFHRLAREDKNSAARASDARVSAPLPRRNFPLSSDSSWRNVWALYAAGILLFCALGLFAYRMSTRSGQESTRFAQPPPTPLNAPSPASLEEQLSDASHDRAVANAEIAQRDKVIASLRQAMARQSAEINGLKAAQSQLESSLKADDTSKENLTQQKADLTQRLDSAEKNSRALQGKLDSLAQQSTDDTAVVKASDAKVNDLTRQLQEQQTAVRERDEMLAHDRDIREVMGARDLYIAEIYDVAGTGETKKPYGRVFYTRGKSLIFYAYDLDQQAELKRAGAFQAWGRRGPDRQQALNLGVFYEDNANKKRWILKCDDPKTLDQIDAVFVTVEPRGGSHKPSSRTLLFASLKIDPNHP